MAEPGLTDRLAAAGEAFSNPAPAGAVASEPTALDAAGTRSPLAGFVGPTTGPVTFEERPFIGKISLRGDLDDAGFAAGTASALGTGLPREPLTFVEHDGYRIHWIAYDHWMIYAPEGAEGPLLAKLRAALDGVHHAAVDVSDYYTVIRVSGDKARALLAKGCPLDLHPRAFRPGMCAGSVFHHAALFIAQTAAFDAGGATYDVQVRWSFARYMWDYFTDGAREWQAG